MKQGFVTLCRLVLSAVFAWAAVSKVPDPAGFQGDIASYQLLPTTGAVLLALYLPWLELAAAFGLWIPQVRRGAGLLLGLLLTLFLLGLIAAGIRGLDLRCGCFGSSEASSNVFGLIARDFALLVLVMIVAAWDQRMAALRETRRAVADS